MVNQKKLLKILDFNLQYQTEIDDALIKAASYNKMEVNFYSLGGRPISNFKEYELQDIFETYELNDYKYIIHPDHLTLYWEI